MKRFLQKNHAGEDEDCEAIYPVGSIIFCAFFFIIWNCSISTQVVRAFRDIYNRQYTRAVIILVFPHWIIGIIIPGVIGYSAIGTGGTVLYVTILVVLPYSYSFWRMKRETGAYVEVGMDPEFISGQDRKTYLERNLTFSKVVEESTRALTDSSGLFRTKNPKSDIVVPKGGGEEIDASSSRRDIVCAICLEMYKSADTVCWSRNPACLHAFHKECAMDWLIHKSECPVCRRPYIGTCNTHGKS